MYNRVKFNPEHKFATIEAVIYPILLLAIIWSVFLIDRYFNLNLYLFGVQPQTGSGIKGILFMPFIHGQKDFSHIINNSIPIAVLLGAIIYFYRSIALKVLGLIWFGGGFLLWAIAQNTNSFHIGISGIIYGLFGFLFISGFLRKYLPLQVISLFVAFLYGSLVWGIFPTEERISWEGHLFGMTAGIFAAILFRKEGPKAPKYQYEIEKELGIEPPDLEGMWQQSIEIQNENQKENPSSKAKEEYFNSNQYVQYNLIKKDKEK